MFFSVLQWDDMIAFGMLSPVFLYTIFTIATVRLRKCFANLTTARSRVIRRFFGLAQLTCSIISATFTFNFWSDQRALGGFGFKSHVIEADILEFNPLLLKLPLRVEVVFTI
jgi:hypothetical protein